MYDTTGGSYIVCALSIIQSRARLFYIGGSGEAVGIETAYKGQMKIQKLQI